MSIIINDSLITIIDDKKGNELFKGSQLELEQFLIDAREIALDIQVDIDAEILVENDQNFAFENYKNFATKYKD